MQHLKFSILFSSRTLYSRVGKSVADILAEALNSTIFPDNINQRHIPIVWFLIYKIEVGISFSA